ncbi:MAG TPA: imidazole glycerol phosphate synthase subunit HisH [Ignavibacteria bacterium]
MIGLIDYGAGNLLSVKKALEYLNVNCKVVRSPDDINEIDRIILPGVGAFESAVKNLHNRGLFNFIRDWIHKGNSYLGICLGMQLLMEYSEESTLDIKGFYLIDGNVIKFKCNKVPQIGWNQLKFCKESPLFEDIKDNSFFYFVHSYYINPVDVAYTIGITDYNVPFTAAIQKGNVYGVQFHPEKSSINGLKLIKNWVDLC